MLSTILNWILKPNVAKVGGATIGGGGIVALILGLHSNVTGKIDNISKTVKEDRREYVALSMEPLKTEISNLKKETKETKHLVRDIHNYLLKSSNK